MTPGTTIEQFIYEYDFGDGWTHSVRVQRLMPASEQHDTASGQRVAAQYARAVPER